MLLLGRSCSLYVAKITPTKSCAKPNSVPWQEKEYRELEMVGPSGHYAVILNSFFSLLRKHAHVL